jgi:protein-tyrosine phosphatase
MSRWFLTYGYADVLDDLLIGAYPLDRSDVAMLERIHVQRVLNLTRDEEYRDGDRAAAEAALEEAGIEEHRLGMTDYGSLPSDVLEKAVSEVNSWLHQGIRTYLHCRAGWQRSAAVAAGVIAVREGIDIDEALEFVQTRKPSADPLPHQREDLRHWWESRGRASPRGGGAEEVSEAQARGGAGKRGAGDPD